jgi:hypothetical protein
LLDLITVKQAGRLSGRFLGFITVALKKSKTRFRFSINLKENQITGQKKAQAL